jgi:hypothetical protein
MAQAQRKFLQDYNYYVPGMQAGGDLGQALNGRFPFGALTVADPDGILSLQSIAAAAGTSQTTFAGTYNVDTMSSYGRNLTVIASGAATSNVTVIGRDYLGQKMRESFTLNGANSVVGVKAFKYVDQVNFTNTAATTVDVGWGTKFGLPYTTMAVAREYVDNVVGAAGTFTAPVFTDPQTLTTGDPRGLYVPTTTPNGVKKFELELEFTNFINAANNGGLHGIKHFNT